MVSGEACFETPRSSHFREASSLAPLLVSPSSTAESTFALVFNGSRKEVKAFADIDGVDAGKGRFANPGQECTIESARDERGNYRELLFAPATASNEAAYGGSGSTDTQSSTGSIVVKVASGTHVETYDDGRKRRTNFDRRYERKDGDIGQKRALTVGTTYGRVLEEAEPEKYDMGGRRGNYRDEPYHNRGDGGDEYGYGGSRRRRFELDGELDVTFTIWYTDNYGFRFLADLVDHSEWAYELSQTFKGAPSIQRPDVDIAQLTAPMYKIPPHKLPDMPQESSSALERLIDNIATSCKIDLARTSEMTLYSCLSIMLFDNDQYHPLIYNVIERELNDNERHYVPFLEGDRGFFVPLLAFSRLIRCNFIVFLPDRVKDSKTNILYFEFAPTPFIGKTFALGCLTRDKFYALKNMNTQESSQKKKLKQAHPQPPKGRPANLVVID